MNNIFNLLGLVLERFLRFALIVFSILFIIFLIMIAMPDFIKIDWSKDILTFFVIFGIIAIPFIVVYLQDKKSSYKNVPSNIRNFISYNPDQYKTKFPVLKTIFIIFAIIFIVQFIMLYTSME